LIILSLAGGAFISPLVFLLLIVVVLLFMGPHRGRRSRLEQEIEMANPSTDSIVIEALDDKDLQRMDRAARREKVRMRTFLDKEIPRGHTQ
jgi:hypothetical protein